MGNKCSLNNDKDEETLTEYDKTIYNDKRERIFYGTIAICVLYASFALLLFIASYLSEKVKFLLLNNFLPFTIVYVIGTIIIVFYLIDQVVNFKPFKIDRNSKYDSLSCPDYWTLEKVPITDENKPIFKDLFSSNVDYGLFKYRCKLDNKIFDKYNIYQENSAKGKTETDGLANIPYYKFTTNTETVTNDNTQASVLSSVDENNKHLFVNILNSKYNINVKTVNSNILRDDKKQRFELIKNTLIMNNYSLETTDDKAQIQVFKYKNISDKGSSFNINTINYDISTTANTPLISSKSTDHYIKVDTVSNIVYKSATSAASISDDTVMNVLPMICDSTYPMYLASRDEVTNKNDNKFDNNVFRCAYSKICKVPWSDMNCDKYTDRT